MENFNTFGLSELDQIMPRLYVRWLLCIPISEGSPSKAEIVDILQSGFSEALREMPLLQGVISPKDSDPSRLEVHIPNSIPNFEMRIQNHDADHDGTFPTYEGLKQAEFPASSLPDKMLTPPEVEPRPVFDILATFIRGGLLLCIKCHHAVVDGGGLGLVVKFLAQKCYSHSIQEPLESISPPSFDRSLLPRAKPSATNIENGFRIADLNLATQAPTKEYAPMISHTFKFCPESLQRLKKLCTTEMGTVSTQDALTSLLYASVSHARGRRLTEASTETTTIPSVMGIAVNGRSRLSSQTMSYAGNVTLYATFSCPIVLPVEKIEHYDDVGRLSHHLNFPSIAAKSRRAVTAVDQDSITSVISAAASLEDVSRLQPWFADFFQGTDFFITSGADFPVFEQEWWVGGKVDALRIPFKGHWDGSCAVLATKDRSKGLDIMLGLREDDMVIVRELLFAFGAKLA